MGSEMQRTFFCCGARSRLTALALVVMSVVLTACAANDRVSFPEDTQLIVLRHADRFGEDLNARGIARANALPAALEGVPIDAIYSPGIQRNLDTAAPLAAARGLEVIRIPADGAARRLMSENAGKSVVWIGNKGNIAEIWEALGAPEPAPLNYGDLVLLRRGPLGAVTATRQTFGQVPDETR